MRGDLLQGRPNIEQRVVRLKKDFDRRINRYQSLALNDHKGPKKSESFFALLDGCRAFFQIVSICNPITVSR